MRSLGRAKRAAAIGRTVSRPERHSHPQQPDLSPTFTATEAKNEFGKILERAIQGETVLITKHDSPKAVLISLDRFNALKRAPEIKLDTLSGEFDALLERLQGEKARVRMHTAFHATPRQLGKAAVAAARKRG